MAHVAAAAVLLVLAGGCSAPHSDAPPSLGGAGVSALSAPVPVDGATDGITVTGQGRVSGAPDVLRATVGVEVQGEEVQDALEVANAGAERVRAALRDAGVGEDDVRTADVRVEPRFGPQGAEQGVVVTNLVEAAFRDLDGAGEALDAVLRAGGEDARLRGLAFELDENGELLADARAAAVADARAKAEEYAQAAGVGLGGLVRLHEVGADAPGRQTDFAADEDSAAAAVPLEPGLSDVDVTITATWAVGA